MASLLPLFLPFSSAVADSPDHRRAVGAAAAAVRLAWNRGGGRALEGVPLVLHPQVVLDEASRGFTVPERVGLDDVEAVLDAVERWVETGKGGEDGVRYVEVAWVALQATIASRATDDYFGPGRVAYFQADAVCDLARAAWRHRLSRGREWVGRASWAVHAAAGALELLERTDYREGAAAEALEEALGAASQALASQGPRANPGSLERFLRGA